jgi:hypothetical protein
LDYAFGWSDVSLAYRHLYYGQKGDQLIQSLALSGPLLVRRSGSDLDRWV